MLSGKIVISNIAQSRQQYWGKKNVDKDPWHRKADYEGNIWSYDIPRTVFIPKIGEILDLFLKILEKSEIYVPKY